MSDSSRNLPSITGHSGGAVSKRDLKAAISLLDEFVANKAEDNNNERLRDAAEHIRRTARSLFVIAKAIDEVLDERG